MLIKKTIHDAFISFAKTMTESEIVAELFKLYQQAVEK